MIKRGKDLELVSEIVGEVVTYLITKNVSTLKLALSEGKRRKLLIWVSITS